MATITRLRNRLLTASLLASLASLMLSASALAGPGSGPWPK